MPMARGRLLRFGLVFVPSLVLLAWPFGFVGRAVTSAVCSGVNRGILNTRDRGAVPTLELDNRPGFEWQVVEVVRNRPGHFVLARFEVDLHQTLYLPIMVFVALILAGRISFGNRDFRWGLEVAGVALLVMRASLRFILLGRWTDGLAHDGAFDTFLHIAQLALAAPRGMAVALPLILWLLISRKAMLEATRAS